MSLQYSVIQAGAGNEPQSVVKFILVLVGELATNSVLFFVLLSLEALIRVRLNFLPLIVVVIVVVVVFTIFIFPLAFVSLLLAPAWSAGAYTRAAFVAWNSSNGASRRFGLLIALVPRIPTLVLRVYPAKMLKNPQQISADDIADNASNGI